MAPEKLASEIARAFIGHAIATEAQEPTDTTYTQSAVRLTELEDLARATARLGEVLAAILGKEMLGLRGIVQGVQRMPGDEQFADLGHLAKLVTRHVKSKKAQSVASDVIDALRRAVVFSGHVGEAVRRVTGLTVYLPMDIKDFRVYRRSYSTLSFLKDHPEWLLFLDALHAPQHQLSD
ncbi:MAG: hypothetical protein HYV27_17615 [Candidatus Hydrogenedentes bacterium]|nr:hypothetical protein [Candidatus Hydrogenedentota bacterium]